MESFDLDDFRKLIKNSVGDLWDKILNEIQEYFEMLPNITFKEDVRERLNLPKTAILQEYTLTEEKLEDPLYLPEILKFLIDIKENNFKFFHPNWSTYHYIKIQDL